MPGAEIKSIKEDTYSRNETEEKDNSENLNKSDWFYRHKGLIHESKLEKAFIPVAAIQYLVLFSILFTGVGKRSNLPYVSYIMALFSLVYVVFIIIMLIKLRKIKDAFYIKKEYSGNLKIFPPLFSPLLKKA